MSQRNQKILQYLNEAHASEVGLVRVLQSQIAMTPRGSYRTGLEKHLGETRDHAGRLQARMRALGEGGGGVLQAGIGIAETVAAQALALGKTPLDLLRGSGGEEKVLKNAKDACATEALEIATYTAIEQLAQSVGDDETARLAKSIRADEQRMLDRILKEIPKLTEAVVRADVRGNGSYDIATTGAGETARAAGRTTRAAAKKGGTKAKRTARKAPGADARGGHRPRRRRPRAGSPDRPLHEPQRGRDPRAAARALPGRARARSTSTSAGTTTAAPITDRISTLRTSEPWSGYDELTVDELRSALAQADESRARKPRASTRRRTRTAPA